MHEVSVRNALVCTLNRLCYSIIAYFIVCMLCVNYSCICSVDYVEIFRG